MARSRPSRAVLYAILFLVFFQLIADFVEAVYAFGLLGKDLPVEMASMLLLFSPLILLLVPRDALGWLLVLAGELMLACRIVEPLLDTRGRMLAAGLGAGCFLLLLPLLITRQDGVRDIQRGRTFGAGLAAALSLSILFRAIHSGSDISTWGWFQAIGWVLAAVAGVLLLGFLPRRGMAPARHPPGQPESGAEPDPPGFWHTAGLALGAISVLILLYFSFSSPTVIARWTGLSYPLILSIIAVILSLSAVAVALAPGLLASLTPGVVQVWNILFVLSLVLTIFVHQVWLPADPGAYPLAEPVLGPLHRIPLLVTLLLFPVILVDWMLFVQDMAGWRAPTRRLGGAFGLASVFLLLMILAQVFTTTYAYIPVAGPIFRDRFWLVYLVLGTTMALPVLLVRPGAYDLGQAARGFKRKPLLAGLMVLANLLAVTAALLTTANPAPIEGPQAGLKVLTYNIQQGYDPEGLRNYDGQLDLIRKADAGIIGLQESDTNRIAGGNADVVRYFADGLDMYSYYGPSPVVGTFGIALLSRYPIENPRTFYMYSYESQAGELVDLEQTATIAAQVRVEDRTFNVFVTHLGNGGPMFQQEAILTEIEGLEDVILMGDFNFDPHAEQYARTVEMLADAWAIRWPGRDKRTADYTGKGIDHIFVSPGTRVAEARYLPDPEADHPATIAVIEW